VEKLKEAVRPTYKCALVPRPLALVIGRSEWLVKSRLGMLEECSQLKGDPVDCWRVLIDWRRAERRSVWQRAEKRSMKKLNSLT